MVIDPVDTDKIIFIMKVRPALFFEMKYVDSFDISLNLVDSERFY